jgi:vacuolar-type H+-ATPase subunit I/STV1
MKTFKTVEELIEFINDPSNIEALDNGEVTLKAWIELDAAATKHKSDYKRASDDKKPLLKKNEEANKQIAELTEQLEAVNTELTGLKEVHSGNDKEALQKLVKENSDLKVQNNAKDSKIRELEKDQPRKAELEKQVEALQTANNRSRIIAEARKEAAHLNVPQYIIDDADYFERMVVDDFTIDEVGGIFTKGDNPQSMANYMATKQKEKQHWNPTSEGAGIDSMTTTDGSGRVFADRNEALIACFTT